MNWCLLPDQNEMNSWSDWVPTVPFLSSCWQIQPEVWVFRERTGRKLQFSPKVIFSTVERKAPLTVQTQVTVFLTSCYLFIIWYHIIQSFKVTVGACGGLLGAGADNVCDAQGSWLWPECCPVPLCRGRSAPGLAAQRLSSLLVHKNNTMVAQTQGLSQPGDLTVSSTSIQRKSLVKNKVFLELIIQSLDAFSF